jgi:hypothetical protein
VAGRLGPHGSQPGGGPVSAGDGPAARGVAGPRWLVAGSYPPTPGPAAAATIGAVRRLWEAGAEVVVASPRPSAAGEVLRAVGPAVGPALVKLGRHHGCAGVVVCLEEGWPFGPGRRWAGLALAAGPERTARSLGRALSHFEQAELVVVGQPSVSAEVLAVLWPAVSQVTASSSTAAAWLVALGAPTVGLAPTGGAPVAGLPVGRVGPLEPGDLLLVTRARRQLGRLARLLLGRHAPAVRARLGRILRP